MPPGFKPYLIRAIYEWCADQGWSPYLAVAVDDSCRVPKAHVRNGHIVLDISMGATKDLDLGIDAISFQARFGGVAQHLYVPINRVIGLFPEHDQSLGTFFEIEEKVTLASVDAQSVSQAPEQSHIPSDDGLGRPRFTRVK